MADERWVQSPRIHGEASVPGPVDVARARTSELDPAESAPNEPGEEPLPDRRYEPL